LKSHNTLYIPILQHFQEEVFFPMIDKSGDYYSIYIKPTFLYVGKT